MNSSVQENHDDSVSSSDGVASCPYRLQVAASVTRYQTCTVDPRPGRAVHCPDLNACLVNEGRTVPVDCQAVHFGYAIPVNVVPLPEEPHLAELVLDPAPELTPEAVSYLLRHHPQLRKENDKRINGETNNNNNNMAATAKHEHLRRGKFVPEPEEDIAAIAKQISDHAEAIYQTWKSRGLAPTEILTCHSNATAADKFGSALTPQPQTSQHQPVVDLPSLNANNLEQLVNNFVVEDKARLAAARQKTPAKTIPSSIQYARQKFEKQLPDNQMKPSSPPSSSFLKPQHDPVKSHQSPAKSPTSISGHPSYSPHHIRTSPQSPVTHQHGIQLETIETTFPEDIIVNKVQPKRSPDAVDSSPGSGLTTWPLKNKTISVGGERRKVAPPTAEEDSNRTEETPNSKYATLPTNKVNNNKNTAAYLDEVAREEERLINALKTGIIIAEDPASMTSSATSPAKKKSSILQKKANKDKLAGRKEKEGKVGSQPLSITSSRAVEVVGPVPSPAKSPGDATKQHQVLGSKDDMSNMSMVDYAKIRYKTAQQNPLTQQRLDDVKQFDQQRLNAGSPEKLVQHQVIPVARNRFEIAPRSAAGNTSPPGENSWRPDWAPGRFAATDSAHPGPRRAVSAGPGRARHPPIESVPHPELTSQQRQHIRAAAAANSLHATGSNPVRPFLTRGSVAERVLIFEKCPTELLLEKRRSTPAISTWRTGHEVHAKAQTYSRDKHTPQPALLPPNTTLQRHVKANRNVHIPRFHFPQGKPATDHQQDTVLQKLAAVFQQFPSQQVPREKFSTVTKACDCPLYWKMPLFLAGGGEKLGYIDANTFIEFWKKLTHKCHDHASKFIYILSRGQREYLTPEDFIPLVQDVVDTHPGLTFLKEATEFHSRYVHTVIARIFYCVNRSWSGHVSLPELRRSNLLRVVQVLEEEEDINQVTSYFSYEHFYVIYCKFWELDRDHDLFIDKQDLTRHSDHALSTRMIERIFSGAVTRGSPQTLREEKMSYTEFVWFLLSEEDKQHPTAIEYWFRCMDLDGDGFLSMYELEYFYEEQLQRMEAIGIETLPFEDCLCQMLDMIHPITPGKISLTDLKRCKMTSIFFDTFFNLEKYLDHEQRDPFASQRDHDTDGHELSDWDRYAAEEYELLVAEEGGNDHQEDFMYEDDIENEDALSPNLDNIVANNNNSEKKILARNGEWDKPSFKVTDFDMDDNGDSDDYAADSDCSV